MPKEVPRVAAEAAKIMYDEVVLTDPRAVTLSVESRARTDISSADFDQRKPLEFDLGTVIAAQFDLSHAGGDSPIEAAAPGDRSMRLPPQLIRKGPVVKVLLLVDGQPQLTVRNPLIFMDVRDKAVDQRRNNLMTRAAVWGLALTSPVVLGIASGGGSPPS